MVVPNTPEVVVAQVVPPASGVPGQITVSIPVEVANSGAAVNFNLPDEVVTAMDTVGVAGTAVTMSDGTTLPSWLTYNADSKSFSMEGAPAEMTSVVVRVTVGGQTWDMEIMIQ